LETIVIADTDVVIDFFSGIETAASTVANLILKDGLALTSVTVFELYAGITGKKRLKQIDDLVSIMLVYPLEKKDAETAARVYSDLRKAGKLIGNQDILIAGICITQDIPPVYKKYSALFKDFPPEAFQPSTSARAIIV